MTLTGDAPRSSRLPNPEQGMVIGHDHGPIRVMAGAGTGKTYTLTSRVVRLIADGLARPDEVLALTFSNKAASEMRDRIGEACLALGVPPDAEPVTVLTYHSFGNAVIREWGGMIGLPPSPPLLSNSERWLLLWECLPRIDFQSVDLMYLRSAYGSPLPNILKLGSRLKDELAGPQQLLHYLESGQRAGVSLNDDDAKRQDTLGDYARALLVYEEERRARGVIDYGDQVALAVEALRLPEVRAAYRDRYRFVLVDEYQDTNYAQSVMVQLLVQDWPHQNVCVVGDIRQAIYRFRGAAPDNLLRFPDDFPGARPFALRRNYRSSTQILAAANAVWQDAAGGDAQADLVSVDDRQGPPVIACVCEDPDSEWEWIARRIRAHHDLGVPYRDMAVLIRKNEMKRQLWRGLLDRGIPAVMTGGTDLLRTPEVREVLAYLRALARPSDNIALAHIASSDSFGLDEAALYDLIGPLPRGRSLFDVLIDRAADASAPTGLRLFLATYSRLLADAATLSPARIVERIIGLRRGAHTDLQRTNVYRFHAIAQDFASGHARGAGVSFQRAGVSLLGSFVAYLNLLLSAPSDEEEATDVVQEDAVQVLTVHGAKGLERQVVFVATASEQDFTLSNQTDPAPSALRHPAAGMPQSDDFPEERRFKKALGDWEKGQHRLEEQRIVYVALTRAKDQLYLSWHRLPLNRGKERRPLDVLRHVLPLTAAETFNRVDWDDGVAVVEAIDPLTEARIFARRQAKVWAGWRLDEFDDDGVALAEGLSAAWARYVAEDGLLPPGDDTLRTGVQRWRAERRRVEGLLERCLNPAVRPADADRRPVVDVPTTLSYSMLATYQDCGRKAYLRFLAGFPGEPRPSATGAGTAFHAAVEMGAVAQQAGRLVPFQDFVDAFRESAEESHGVEVYTVNEPERAMLQSFWEGPDRLATPLHVEAEFYWRVGPGYLHGFIDRIQRRPDGTLELVDFKTTRVPLSNAEARQSLQLLIYALAAREVYKLRMDRLTLVYPRLGTRVSVSFTDEELRAARMTIVELMERARTASYDDVDTRHCPLCEYRLICPAASSFQ